MTTSGIPSRCLLCDSDSQISPAGFRQIYPQGEGLLVQLAWWECPACRGWFVAPPPSVAMIENQWRIVDYGDPSREEAYTRCRREFVERLIRDLARRVPRGTLLDAGCGNGAFLREAAAAGWKCKGFDPNPASVEIAQSRGLDVRLAWRIEECCAPQEQFQVITLIDVFYYSWHPYADLKTLFRYLQPGGVLVMRLSNKRLILGAMRRLSGEGPARDGRLSRYLQGQFHSISLRSLTRVLRQIGFCSVRATPRAMTAPASALSWQGRAWYLAADMMHLVTLGQVNLSPGILLYASKG